MKMEAKDIAARVIRQITSCKYFSDKQIYTLCLDHTKDERVAREAYRQAARALEKLGYKVGER